MPVSRGDERVKQQRFHRRPVSQSRAAQLRWITQRPSKFASPGVVDDAGQADLEGELSESAIEEFVGMLRSRFGVTGRIERLGSTISWSTDIPRGTGTTNGRNSIHDNFGCM